MRCCVVNCSRTSINSPDTRFYRFPTATHYKFKQERRDKWICAVRRFNADGSLWVPAKGSRICSHHFIGNAKSEHPLSPSYNPSIFPVASANFTASRYTNATKSRPSASKKRNARSRSNGQLDHDAIEENVSRKKFLFFDIPKIEKNDEETEATFSVEDCTNAARNDGICTFDRYTRNNGSTTVRDVGMQVFIPDATDGTRMKKKNTLHGGCETCVSREDRPVEGETRDPEDIEFFNYTEGFSGISGIKDGRQMLELTGVTLSTFHLLIKLLPVIKNIEVSKEKRLLMFLIKIKQGVTFSALSVLFSIDKSVASKAFFSTLKQLAKNTRDSVSWPGRNFAKLTISQALQETHNGLWTVLDCTPFKIKEPSNTKPRNRLADSHCVVKSRSALKVLVACTTSGGISFVSSSYSGQTLDAPIIDDFGFLKFLESNQVLAVPQFFRNDTLTVENSRDARPIGSNKLHTKRIIQRLKSYRILDKLTGNIVRHYEAIVFVCCILVNLD